MVRKCKNSITTETTDVQADEDADNKSSEIDSLTLMILLRQAPETASASVGGKQKRSILLRYSFA